MKKITLLLFLLTAVFSSHAQLGVYEFTQTTSSYTEITGGTLLGTETSDDQRFMDPTILAGGTATTGPGFPIGFNFTFNGEVYDRFGVNNNGWISLGKSSLTPSVNNASTSAYTPISSLVAIAPDELTARISGLGKDLQAQVGASLRIETIGTAPNRELVIQWKNYKKFGTNGTGDSFSFQIRLLETTNEIKIVYGSMVSNANASQNYQVGLRGAPSNLANNFTSRTSSTDWSATTQSLLATESILMNNVIIPASGLTYTFSIPACPPPAGLETSNITQSGASISWNSLTPAPTTYEYFVSTTNVSPLDPGTTTTATSAAISGLIQNTNYFVFLRSNCGAESSQWFLAGTFKTLCSDVTDFFRTFDELTTTGVGVLPDCWSKLGSSTGFYVTTGSVSPMSPSNRLLLSVATATTIFGVMPPVSNLQASTHRLRFKAYATTTNKVLNVGYFTDITDLSTFVQLQSYNMPSTATTAQEFTLVPPALPPGVNQLVFTTPNGVSTTIYIDDVKWEFNSSCQEPSQLTATQITNSSAQLGWVNGGPETGWEIQYGLQNFQLGSGTTVPNVNSNPYLLTGLLENTTYQFYVRAVCTGPINSSWTGPFTFKTKCDDKTDFTENFEGYPTGASNPLADCWERGGNGTVNLTTGSVAPMSPSIRLTMVGNGSLATPTVSYAILPAVSNLQANTHRLRLKAYATAADRYLEVGYLTDPSNVNSYVFIEGLTLPSTTAASATEFTIIPTAIPAGVKHLVFKNQGIATGATTLYVDDVIWEEIPSCLEVTNLQVVATTNASAELTWSEMGSATAWEIEYGAPGFVQGTGTIVPAPSNPFVLTGLLSDTNYVFYVRAACSTSSVSPWTGPLAFKTLCNSVTDYTMNFEGLATGTTSPMPTCWAKGGNGSTYITTGSVAPMSTPNRLTMIASNTANPPTEAYALMPLTSNLQANTHRLKFKAYATTANRIVEVGYLTNPLDISTYFYITDLMLPGTTAATAQEFTVIPGALPQGAVRLVFKNPAYPGGATTLYIDDVVWQAIPTCIEPSSLTLNTITNESATLAWTEGGSATTWEIEYGAPGFTQGFGTLVTATTNPFVLTGLTQNTNYQAYVRAVCSPTDSSYWTESLTFKTLCNEVTEFTQNFENTTTGTTAPMPDCWSKLGNGAVYPTTASVAPMSPPNRLYMTANSTATTPTVSYAVLPAVSNLQGNSHRLRFKAYSISTVRVIQVGYLTNPTDASTFNLIQELTLPGTTAATAEEFIIYPGVLPVGVKHLAIKNPGVTGVTTAYFDDFSWEPIPSCIEPLGLSIAAVSSGSATLAWTEGGTATGWEIEYGAPGFVQGTGTTVAAPTNPFVLSGLTQDTAYSFYVRSVCSSTDSSAWTGPLAFRTLCTDVTEFVQVLEGFPTGSTNPMPTCWSRLGTGSTYITTGSVAPMSPGNRLYMFASGTATPPTQALAVMPPVSNLGAATHQLKFKAYCTTANRFIEVGYLTNPTDASSFVVLTSFDLPATAATTALEFTYAPAALPAGVKNLALRNAPLAGGTALIYVDDVSWNLAPTIAPVCATNIIATPNVTCGNFATTFAWDATPGADGYKMTIGTTAGGSDVLNNINIGSNPSYSFVGNLNTTYYYKIVPFNGAGDATGCTEQMFTTVATGCYCTSLPTSNDGLGITNVLLQATNFPTADVFYFDHSATAIDVVQGTTANLQVTYATGYAYNTFVWIDFNDNFTFEASELVFTGVSTNANPTTYNASFAIPVDAALGAHKMRMSTGDANFNTVANPCYSGTYGVTLDFTVNVQPGLGVGDFDNASFKFYPNPVNDQLTVSYSNVISDVAVYNLLGQQVATVKPNANQTQVDLSSLTAGTYMVKVTSDEVSKTIKVVKN